MGQVIALQRAAVDLELLEILEEMTAAVRKGEGKGLNALFERADGSVRVITKGTFAKDPERALGIASRAIDTYCQRTGTPNPKVAESCGLPPRLRKAWR